MSNGTPANRVAFQSSTVNGNTSLEVLTNGTSVQSGISFANSSDLANNSLGQILINSTDYRFNSNLRGTGTYLPMTFFAGGSERVRIVGGTGSDVGNVGIGTSSPAATALLDVQSTTKGVRFPNMTTTQKTAITPSAGTVVFDTTLSKLCVYSGAAWQTITSV
jgi:hypothetical protein